jgi:hypothetical protein
MKESKPDSSSQKSSTGRLANALPFLFIILFLGGWSTGFYALQESDPGTIAEGLRCLTFFGGLAVAVLLGAVIGSFLKRMAWKALRKKLAGNK